jgi:hypothetical protein
MSDVILVFRYFRLVWFSGYEQRKGQASVQHSVGVLAAPAGVDVRVPQRYRVARRAQAQVRAPARLRPRQEGAIRCYSE